MNTTQLTLDSYMQRVRQRAATAAYRARHPERAKATNEAYRKRNIEKCRARGASWRARNPEKQRLSKRRARLRKEFGLSLEQFDAMLAAQGGVCAICKQPETRQRSGIKTLSIDHCHATGRVRGLLCNRCNRAIGLLQDTAEICDAAAEYLRR